MRLGNKKENSSFEEKLSSVQDISKIINKKILTNSDNTSVKIKKRSQSLNPSSKNKVSQNEEKIQVKSAKDLNVNLHSFHNHIKEITQLYEKDRNSLDEHKREEIFTQKFSEYINRKQSNQMDLSVISEKDDINTSISFMEKENKIRNFIFSAIQEIRNISTKQATCNKKPIIDNENKDLSKKTFYMSRKFQNEKDP